MDIQRRFAYIILTIGTKKNIKMLDPHFKIKGSKIYNTKK